MIALIILWEFLGICGYFMLRQGSLVSFERALGKKAAWGDADVLAGLLYTLSGPIFFFQALLMEGRNCFRRRPHESP